MKPAFALFPLLLAAGLAACSPAEDAPDPGAVPVEPTLEAPVEPSFPSGPEAVAEAAAQPVDADPLALTAFTPATNPCARRNQAALAGSVEPVAFTGSM